MKTLAPGRVASGEVFEYDQLIWDTDIFMETRLVARERYTLKPESPAVGVMRAQFPTAYYASCFIFSPRLSKQSPCWEVLDGLHNAETWIGFGPLVGNSGWAIKVLASGSIELRKALNAIRATLYASLGTTAPDLRRV